MVNDYDASEDEYYEEGFESDGLRWMSVVVVLFVVIGFFTLAWYAYRAGTQQFNSGEVMLVEADDEPYRVEPEDEGGKEFPHQDKTVYETIGDDKSSKKSSDKLGDEVEEPIIGRVIGGEKEIANKIDKEEIILNKNDDIAVEVDKYEKQIAKEAEPKRFMEKAAPVVKNVEKPKPKKVVQKKVESKKSTVGFGKYGVQIAALKSYADAQRHWAKISKKHSSVIGGKPHKISKAVVKGVTYYRVKVGGWGSKSAAKDGCNKLKARGQSCMVR